MAGNLITLDVRTREQWRQWLARRRSGKSRELTEDALSVAEVGGNMIGEALQAAQRPEAAADLLATGDFTLVKRCEDETCVLWFYDQTKSHHRRWCSTVLCGNRHKVAAYRKRRRAEGV